MLAVSIIIYKIYHEFKFNSMLFEYVGKNTLTIYSTHFLFLYIFRDFNFPIIKFFPILSIFFYSILSIILSLSLAFLFKNLKSFNFIIYGRL